MSNEEMLAIKNEIQIFLDTYTNVNKRSKNEGSSHCRYFSPDGTKCAVGNRINEEYKDKIVGYYNTVTFDSLLHSMEMEFDITPEKLLIGTASVVDRDCFRLLQMIHDIDKYWNDTCINSTGIDEIVRYLKYHMINPDTFTYRNEKITNLI